MLTVNSLDCGQWQMLTLYRNDTSQPITKIFVTGNYVGDLYAISVPYFEQIHPRGLVFTMQIGKI